MNQSDLWTPARRIEQAFARALRRLARRLNAIVKGLRDPRQIIAALKRYAQSKEFRQFAEAVAMKMVTGLFRDMGRTWRQAAAAHGMGRELYQALMQELRTGRKGERLDELITDTTYCIKTIPEDIGKEVAAYVEREALKGRRASDIEREIQLMFPQHTKARAELIARTQVSYTQTNLIKVRAEAIGLNWYVWRPVGGNKGDGRTRTSHRQMSGVVVNWNDPPAPEDLFPRYTKSGRPYRNTLGHYHAGQCPNCRCYPEPIVDLDLTTWPARVYRNGRITTMTRRQFEQVMR
ncbi:MAG: head morphogenesis protein [Selenomonas sp.]|nr:head morphogenesis protein [Selenomonas sp.]